MSKIWITQISLNIVIKVESQNIICSIRQYIEEVLVNKSDLWNQQIILMWSDLIGLEFCDFNLYLLVSFILVLFYLSFYDYLKITVIN